MRISWMNPGACCRLSNVRAGQALYQEHAVDALHGTAVVSLQLPAVDALPDVRPGPEPAPVRWSRTR